MRYREIIGTVVTYLIVPAAALSAQKTWHPSLTTVAPTIVRDGATITLTGTDLTPPGWRLRVHGPTRYGEVVTPLVICNGSLPCSNTSVTLPARKEWRGDSLYVEWSVVDPTRAGTNQIPAGERVRYLPSAIVVTAPPVVTFAGTPLTADAGTFPEPQLFVQNGQVVLKGKYLRRTSMPAVAFRGTTLQVIGHSYEPQGQLTQAGSTGGAGADRLVFAVPTEHGIGPLTVNNSLGTATTDVINVLPPVFTRVDQVTPTGYAPLNPPNTLRRGSRYVVRGQRLSIFRYSGAAIVQRRTGQVIANGTPLPHVGGSDTTVLFDVSPTSSRLSLAVQTPGGSSGAQDFEVVDAPARISVVAVTPASATVISGTRLSLRVTLAIPPDAPANHGSLILSQSGPAGALTWPVSIPVAGSEMRLEVDVGFMQTTTQTTLTIAHESHAAGLGTGTRQVAITIRPPRPIAIGGADTLRTGTSVPLEVTLDSTTRASSPLYVQLSSSNPNVVTVPSTASISGRTARFTVTLPPNLVPPSTITVTSTIDGVSIQRAFPIKTPRFTQLTASPTTARTDQMVVVVAQFEGQLPRDTEVNMTASDTALHRVNHAGVREQYQQDFLVSRSLTENKQVTITAGIGGYTASTIVQLVPIVIGNVSASPNPGRAGTTVNVTATLTHSAGPNWIVQFSSADPSVAQVVSPSVAVSGTSASTAIQVLSSVTSTRTVAITATLRRDPFSPIISVQSVVLTVTPN